jgi:hypothetical protein
MASLLVVKSGGLWNNISAKGVNGDEERVGPDRAWRSTADYPHKNE